MTIVTCEEYVQTLEKHNEHYREIIKILLEIIKEWKHKEDEN